MGVCSVSKEGGEKFDGVGEKGVLRELTARLGVWRVSREG
jgi:hypothetical protein